MDRTDLFVNFSLFIFVLGQGLDFLTTWRSMSIDQMYELNGFLLGMFDVFGVLPGLILSKGLVSVLLITVYAGYKYYNIDVVVSGKSVDLRSLFGFMFLVAGLFYLVLGVNNFLLIEHLGESLLV